MKQIALALLVALLASASAGADEWMTDYDKAIEMAKQEKKAVLLNFTGSDWCVWCMKLDKDVFSKPDFKKYAREKLVLVEIDFPQGKPLTRKLQKQNEALRDKFGINGFPTLILLDSAGNKLGEYSGYVEGGPDAFIALLEKFLVRTSKS
jgi:thioredoxin-related protein